MLLNTDLNRSFSVLKERNVSRLISVSEVALCWGGGCVGQRDLEKATIMLQKDCTIVALTIR